MPATTHTFPHGAQAWTDATGTGGQRGDGSALRGKGNRAHLEEVVGIQRNAHHLRRAGARVVKWRVASRAQPSRFRARAVASRTPRDARPRATRSPRQLRPGRAQRRHRRVFARVAFGEHPSGAESILVVYFTRSGRLTRGHIHHITRVRFASSPPPFRDTITRVVCLRPPPPPVRSPVGVPRRPTPAEPPAPSSDHSRANPSPSPPP